MTPARRTAAVPLRTQLVALLVATVGLVVLLTGLSSTAALRGYLVEQVDDQLEETLRPRRGPGPAPGPGPGGGGGGGGDRRFAAPGSYVAALFDASGALLRVEGLTADDPDRPDLPDLDAESAEGLAGDTFTVDAVSGDGRWRVRVQPLRDGSTRVAALPLEGTAAAVRRLLLVHVLVGVLALLVAGALARLGVRRSLRPLVHVERTAEAIAGGDLSVRVPEADPRTEVGSLAASFNSMVDRFEQAFTAQQRSEAAARGSEERMRRFVADASHELRTPLTSIRGFAELYRQGAVGDDAQVAQVMRRIEDEGTRMGMLVEDLLLLARLDQARPLDRVPVDLARVAADVVHDAQATAAGHEVRLLAPDDAGAVVLGDDPRLRQVVGNLVANAVTHTPAGTSVEVLVRVVPDTVVLEVRDDGPGMSPDVAARVFERFYRADASRVRGAASTGSGLGLSIVAGIVEAHGGTYDVESALGAGTTFRVRLPAAAKD